jgi:F0F1-type ATP synthase membrane subunit c/vacuolar-type H+-ATPase subunit K
LKLEWMGMDGAAQHGESAGRMMMKGMVMVGMVERLLVLGFSPGLALNDCL